MKKGGKGIKNIGKGVVVVVVAGGVFDDALPPATPVLLCNFLNFLSARLQCFYVLVVNGAF